MGQRSQIYVRYNGKLLFARYFQWNYGERMISRARYGIEYIKDYLDNGYTWVFDPRTSDCRKLQRIFDVNFDMKDVALSTDIVQEYKEYGDGFEVCDYIFNQQDNNNGQLFVDIVGNQILYCFRYWDYPSHNDLILDGNEYMKHDVSPSWPGTPDHNPAYDNCYLEKDEIDTCLENIKEIESMANLMSREQLDDFLTNTITEWDELKQVIN